MRSDIEKIRSGYAVFSGRAQAQGIIFSRCCVHKNLVHEEGQKQPMAKAAGVRWQVGRIQRILKTSATINHAAILLQQKSTPLKKR